MSQKISFNFLGGETTNKLIVAIIVILILGGIYAGSLLKMKSYGATPEEATNTIKIGCTYTSKGPYAEISQEIKKGLELWAENANKYGIKAGDKVFNVELVCKDIKDDPLATATTYNSLAKVDKVNFLIGPPGNEFAKKAIDIAETNKKPLILTFTDDNNIFTGSSYQYTFMLMSPISKQIQDTLNAIQEIDSNASNIAIIYENTTYPDLIYTRLRSQLSVMKEFKIVYENSFNKGQNPSTLVDELARGNTEPDVAILIVYSDTALANLIQSLKQADIPTLKMILVFAPETTIYKASENLGTDMEGIIYVSQWEENAPFNPFYAANLGLPWYGYITTEDFIEQYLAKYNEEPTYYSVLGYTAGLLLQAAIEKAGTIDPDTVASTLLNMHLMTFYGSIGFQGSDWYVGGYPGLQEAHEVLLVQFQVEGGNLVKTIVWPQAYSTGQILYPLP